MVKLEKDIEKKQPEGAQERTVSLKRREESVPRGKGWSTLLNIPKAKW